MADIQPLSPSSFSPPREPLDDRSQRVESRQDKKDLEQKDLEQDILDAEIDIPSEAGVQATVEMKDKNVGARFKSDRELWLEAEYKLLKEKFKNTKKTCSGQKKEIKRLMSNKHEKQVVTNRLSKIKNLSASRIKLLVNDQKHVWNTTADIARCAVFYSMGKRAYNYAKENNPSGWYASATTINRWLSEFQVKPGFQNDAINIIKKMKESPKHQKDNLFHHTCLVFDEIHIQDDSVEMDKKTQTIYGPHKKLQVVQIRGLGSK